MNKWFYRAVGTVGIAGGFLLLGGGAAQAEDVDATPVSDPKQPQGLLDGFLTPLAGDDFSQVNRGPNAKDATSDVVLGGPLGSLGDDVAPTRDLGFVGSAARSPTASVSSDALGHGSLDRALGAGGDAHAEKPSLISGLPVPGTFSETVDATRAVDSLSLSETTTSVLDGANGLSADAGGMRDLVPATPDVDASRASAAVPASLGLVRGEPVPGVGTRRAVLGNTSGVVRSTGSQAQSLVPALIGDALSAQHPELLTRTFEYAEPEARPPAATLPLVGDLNLDGVRAASDNPRHDLPIVGALSPLGGLPGGGAPVTTLPAPADADDARPSTKAPTRRAHSTSERPVAGEDADYA